MQRFSRRHGIMIKGFSEEARRIVMSHSWPGNVRELQNVIERAVILCGDNGYLEPRHLGLAPSNHDPQRVPALNLSDEFPKVESFGNGFPTLAEIEKRHIFSALNHCRGNRTHAAKLLDVSIRTLRNKLHEYNGTAPAIQQEDAAGVS
jgi:DNA-binding NtrC family response regulator